MGSLTPCGCKMMEMQSKTDSTGHLVVDGVTGGYVYTCIMDWDREKVDQLYEEFSEIRLALMNLARIYKKNKIPFGTCPAPEYVSPDSEEMKVWSIYIKDSDLRQDPDAENDAEQFEAECDLAEAHIGKGADREQTLMTWTDGRKLCYMYANAVPILVIESTEEMFAMNYVLHACAKEITISDKNQD